MRMFSEEQLTDIKFRKSVIDEILGGENTRRKQEHKKRYDLYKDKTYLYVRDLFAARGLRKETVAEMTTFLNNLSIYKKVINKLARSYSGGIDRDFGEDSERLSELYKLTAIDKTMRKADRYRESHKNCFVSVLPFLDHGESTDEAPRYRLKTKVYAPHEYDVIEDHEDREIARCVILNEKVGTFHGEAASEYHAGVHPSNRPTLKAVTNGKDDTIADARSDSDSKERFIWWSSNYHFTTNEKGEVVSDGDTLNPIQRIPGVFISEDQDGFFWAEGGEDLADGAVKINTMLTDLDYIMWLQGFGQLVITGSNVPDQVKIGPQNVIAVNYDKDREAEPKIQILNHNPPIDDWLKAIEQKTALTLTTNDLSPSTVSTKLDATNPAAGIALLIENSEAINNLEDKQKDFQVAERELYPVIAKWHNLYNENGWLTGAFAAVGTVPEDADLAVMFHDIKPQITEGQKLDDLKKRKDLGISTMVDLILKDNPDMTEQQAVDKLAEITAEKANRAAAAMSGMIARSEGEEDEEDGEVVEDTTPELTGNPAGVNENVVTDASVALNGAQVSSLVEVVSKVMLGELPRESGLSIIRVAFALSQVQAEAVFKGVLEGSIRNDGEEQS